MLKKNDWRQQSNRRVVVTGLGAIGPNGNDVEMIWNNVAKGISGVAPITLFDPSHIASKVAGEVKGFDFKGFFSKRELRRFDRYTQLVLVACEEAVIQAGWQRYKPARERVGIFVGTGAAGISSLERNHSRFLKNDIRHLDSALAPMILANMGGSEIAIRYGFEGTSYAPVAACATGNQSIGLGADSIVSGDIDCAVVGAGESLMTEFMFQAFCQLKTLTTRDCLPQEASCPFSKFRDGFVMSEGAGILLLEELEYAKQNNHEPLAEVVGWSSTIDAYHITSPHPSGEIAARAFANTLSKAGIAPNEIDYINCHGTSTQINDETEAKIMHLALGDICTKIPFSATKSLTGHLLGASSALEAIICVKAIQDGFIPPTVNLPSGSQPYGLDLTPSIGKEADLCTVLSSAFGFGGHNAVIALQKFDELNDKNC